LFRQGGDTLGVIEVFNKYMRQDGHVNTVTPTLVTYNLVRSSTCYFMTSLVVGQ